MAGKTDSFFGEMARLYCGAPFDEYQLPFFRCVNDVAPPH